MYNVNNLGSKDDCVVQLQRKNYGEGTQVCLQLCKAEHG